MGNRFEITAWLDLGEGYRYYDVWAGQRLASALWVLGKCKFAQRMPCVRLVWR